LTVQRTSATGVSTDSMWKYRLADLYPISCTGTVTALLIPFRQEPRLFGKPSAYCRPAGGPGFGHAGISATVGCPVLHVFCEGRESEMPPPNGFDHWVPNKIDSTRSNTTHPCKKRKDGAPSVEMVHAKIVKGRLPARVNRR
jgi:hypothetical protein